MWRRNFWIMCLAGLLAVFVLPTMAQEDSLCDVITVEPSGTGDAGPAETLVNTGLQMTVRNDFATAITLFTQALEIDAELSDVYLYRGCAYANNNEPDSAIADLETYSALINDPSILTDIEAYVDSIMSGPRACSDNDTTNFTDQSDARSYVVSFVEQGANDEDFNFRGLAYICLGEYDQAIRDFSRALDINKNSSQYYSNRGYVYDLQGEVESAITEYERAIQLDNQNDLAWNNLGYALVALGRYDEALEAYNESLKIEYEDDVTLSNRADLYVILERYEEAETDYNEAIRINPRAYNYNARGLFYFNLGYYEDAVVDFLAAVEAAPDDAVYLNNVGYTQYLLGNLEESLAYLNDSLAVDSSYVTARQNRGLTYWQLGEYALCIADYTVLLAVDASDDFSLNNRGLCHEGLNQFDLAIDDFTRAIETNEAQVVELQNRGWVLRQAERYEEALADYTAAIELNEFDAQSWNDRGVVYDYMGEYENALADYSRAIEIDPTYAISYYNRAYMHDELGNPNLAIEDLETYLELAPDSQYREDVEAFLAELGGGDS